jgi:hypothetical protein
MCSLSGRDSLRVLDFLENPPKANTRLMAAARALRKAAVIAVAWHEEPIGKKHDQDAFDCGEEALNEFLRRYARKSHDLGGA